MTSKIENDKIDQSVAKDNVHEKDVIHENAVPVPEILVPKAHSEGRIQRPRQPRITGIRLCGGYEDMNKEDSCDKGCCTPESEAASVKDAKIETN